MRSEAVYLDVVSPTADRGLIVRICRYPEEGFTWLWGHVFIEGRVLAFTQHDVTCDAAVTEIDAEEARYRADTGAARLLVARHGPPARVREARAQGSYMMHEGRHAPHGAGRFEVAIDASFVPGSATVSNRAGRSEALGRVSANVRLGDRTCTIAGYGQFHEQVQTDPRFTTPFTYGTLRSARGGAVFIRGTRGARGHWIDGDDVMPIENIELSPPGSQRAIRLHGGDRVREGSLQTTYDYTIPVGERVRPGTLVTGTIDQTPVSGCLNDFLVDQLTYERI